MAVLAGLIALSVAITYVFPQPFETSGMWEVRISLSNDGKLIVEISMPSVSYTSETRQLALINSEPPSYSESVLTRDGGETVIIQLMSELDSRTSSIRVEIDDKLDELVLHATLSMPIRIVFNPMDIAVVYEEPSGMQIGNNTLYHPGFVELRALLATAP